MGTPVRHSPDAQDTGRPLRETLLGTAWACFPPSSWLPEAVRGLRGENSFDRPSGNAAPL